MSNQSNKIGGFLIDEDLSPELAFLASARGFPSVAVTQMIKLRGRGDAVISKYAIDRDLIVVTNNMVDFERIYQHRECHPGLVFITASNSKLRSKRYQLLMMEHILDEVEQDSPVQEAIEIRAT